MLSLCSGDAGVEQDEGRHPATLADVAGVPRPHCAERRTGTSTETTAPRLDVVLHPTTHSAGVQVPPRCRGTNRGGTGEGVKGRDDSRMCCRYTDAGVCKA